ncbi:MAG TPA: nickel-dependent hydrogenase large subunit [Anaeromyxobacteraceae bacterium]|nr:nickel-dependent hydrogenase large subunit [Anaeromyxobacteraceae bacterium]
MAQVTVPIGPQHPSLKEPASFSITLEGERICHAGMRLGYNHRGMEKAAESRTFIQNIHLLERVCGICSHSHSTNYVSAVEAVAGLKIPDRASHIRTLIGELERLHSHFLWLGVAGHEIGLDTLLMYSWRDREPIMDILAMLCGNRVNYGINTIGGVRRDITPEQLQEVLKVVNQLEERTKYYVELALTDTTLGQRLAKVGHLSHEDAVRFGAVGPTARASKVDRDTRRDAPYLSFGKIEFKVITDDHEDVFGRTVVRVCELIESYKIIRQVIATMPDGPITVKAPRKIPAGEATSRNEAPRGENIHYVRSNGTDKPDRVKVRASTMANLGSVAKMMEANYLADVPIIIAAIDPCFSCTDRAVQVNDLSRGDSTVMSFKDLRKYSIEWYRREAGVDLGALNTKLAKRLAAR